MRRHDTHFPRSFGTRSFGRNYPRGYLSVAHLKSRGREWHFHQTIPGDWAQLSAPISMITPDELLYQTADETPSCIIVRMPTPPSAGTLLARMRHRAIQLAHA